MNAQEVVGSAFPDKRRSRGVQETNRLPSAFHPRPWIEEPPLSACEAAGLQVAVRAWWRGSSGRRRIDCESTEDTWLNSLTSSGLIGDSARHQLQKAYVPNRVVDAGIELGRALIHDETVRRVWAQCQREKRSCAQEFIKRTIAHVVQRYNVKITLSDIHAGSGDTPLPVMILIPKQPLRIERRNAIEVRTRFSCEPVRPVSEDCVEGIAGEPVAERETTEDERSSRKPSCLRSSADADRRCNVGNSEDVSLTGASADCGNRSPIVKLMRKIRLTKRVSSYGNRNEGCRENADSPECNGWTSALPKERTPLIEECSENCVEGEENNDSPDLPDVPDCKSRASVVGEKMASVDSDVMRTQSTEVLMPPLLEVCTSLPRASVSMLDLPPALRRGPTTREQSTRDPPVAEEIRSTLPAKVQRFSSANELLRLPTTNEACRRRASAAAAHFQNEAPSSPARRASALLQNEGRQPWRQSLGPRRPSGRRKMSNFCKWVQIKGVIADANTSEVESEEKQVVKREESGDVKSFIRGPSSKSIMKHIERNIVEVRKLFNQFDEDLSGTIDINEFLPLMAKLLRQPASELDKEEVMRCWDAVDVDGNDSISFDAFSMWYCETFNVEQILDFRDFISQDIVPENDKLIRDVAKALGKDNMMIEKIWYEFDKLDDDKSGSLEYEEFAQLMMHELSPNKDSPQVSKAVLQKFWMDVDPEHAGSVNFQEFAKWYIKFFHGDISPMENYYHMLGSGSRRFSCY